MNLITYIVGRENTVFFYLNQKRQGILTLKKAIVYWHFKNILTNVNDVVEDADNPGTQITRLSNGYYTIRDIQSEFKSKGITLITNYHNGTCSIKSTKKALKIRNLGVLLGFAEDKVFTKDLWHHSGIVKINHGFKYLKVGVDAIVSNEAYGEDGRRSETITVLPIDTTKPLFGEKTDYNDINETVKITPEFNSLKFTVSPNIEWPVDVEVMLDMEIV